MMMDISCFIPLLFVAEFIFFILIGLIVYHTFRS